MAKGQEFSLRRRAPGNRGFGYRLIAAGVLLAILLAFVAGCAGGVSPSLESAPREPVEVVVEREIAAPAAEYAAYDEEGYDAAQGNQAQAVERLIIRNGNISLVVEDTRAAQSAVEEMVAAMAAQGAFVVSSDEYGGTEDSQPRISMSIRVPAARFDEAMERLAELAVQVNSRSQSAQDVTEEYVDLEARLESLEAARQRLLEIMQEARSTKDLLEAEQQLTQREAEIESIKGRMQYLQQSARLASIWIELEPYLLSQPVSDDWRPAETVRVAFEALLGGLRGFGNFLIFFAIAMLPWLLLLALVIYVVVRLVRWRTRARREKGGAAGDEVAG
jgi:hypothetical protein